MKQTKVQNNGSQMPIRMNVAVSITGQQGATLIVVLLFLVLISIAGVMAVRQSRTDLKLATSDQINTLLLQSSDSANQQLEDIINGDPNDKLYEEIFSQGGVLGYYILDDNSKKNEYIYCYNASNDKYLRKNSTIRLPDSGILKGREEGYCNPESPAGYNSKRQTVISQMNIIPKVISDDDEVFSQMVLGKEVQSSSSKKHTIDIRATSSVPAYADSTIIDCLKKPSSLANFSNETQSMMNCLSNLQSPTKVLYQRADVENISKADKCIDFGKGGGIECVLNTSSGSGGNN